MKFYIRGTLLGAIFLLGISFLRSKDLPPDTLQRKEAILRQFVGEFALLTPGMGKYPLHFNLGSGGKEHVNESPMHKITFARAFAMAKYEVTQELYFVVTGTNPSRWRGARNSVEMVNWHEAKQFCTRITTALTEMKLLETGAEIRLPSEAEWEYACRAGSAADYSFGDSVDELGKYCWYKLNAPGNDPPVGKKLPNDWGLFDMHGYVWEWCADTAHPDYKNAPVDGSSWIEISNKERMIRGGSYADSADDVRSARRRAVDAELRSATLGFRCVLAKK